MAFWISFTLSAATKNGGNDPWGGERAVSGSVAVISLLSRTDETIFTSYEANFWKCLEIWIDLTLTVIYIRTILFLWRCIVSNYYFEIHLSVVCSFDEQMLDFLNHWQKHNNPQAQLNMKKTKSRLVLTRRI